MKEALSFLGTTFETLIKSVEDIKVMLAAQTCFSSCDASKIYTNSMMKSILGVGDKTLKKLCDNNLLPYHQTGKEYWYTQSDLDYLMEVTMEQQLRQQERNAYAQREARAGQSVPNHSRSVTNKKK